MTSPSSGRRIQPIRLALRLSLLTVLVGVAAYFTPTPYILDAPGHAEDLSRIVHVAGGRAHGPGRLYMTTVIYEKANLLLCLYALTDPQAQLLPRGYVPYQAPPTWHPDTPQSFNPGAMMELSKYVASIEALRSLGYDIRIVSSGVRVIRLLPESLAAGVLQPGDVIVAANDRPVRSVADLHRILDGIGVGLRRHPARAAVRTLLWQHAGRELKLRVRVGPHLRLKVRRDGRRVGLAVTLTEFDGRPLIGIQTQDAVNRVKLPVPIRIDTHNVNGASAGLMFTLEIVDQLTPRGITRGRRIAGTGTMNLDGVVGPIEGAHLKAIAAERVGASIFLVPEENYPDVRGDEGRLHIIPVRSLQQALAALGVRQRALRFRDRDSE